MSTTTLVLFIISLLLFFGVLYQINHYTVIEYFSQPENITTNHTVNLPINTTVSCTNICGPPGRCSKTGNQCITDVDCPGCQPPTPKVILPTVIIKGQNQAGKLTNGVTPTYSTLTTDIGTNAKLYNKLLTPPIQYNEGINTWRYSFDIGNELYQKRYNPNLNKYPPRTTLSGQFNDVGPLAANAYL